MPYAIDDYVKVYLPFESDTIDIVSKTVLTARNLSGYESISTAIPVPCIHSNLIFGSIPLTFGSNDFCIEFFYKDMEGSAADWDNMFAFGTHDTAGGDNTSFCLGFRGGRFRLCPSRDGITIDLGKTFSDFRGQLRHVAVTRHNGNFITYLDGIPLSSVNTMSFPDSTTSFYMNGKGCSGTINAYVSQLKISIGTPVHTGPFDPYAYAFGNSYKGFIDKENMLWSYK